MGKNKGYNSMMTFIYCLIILVVLPVSIFIGARKTIDYRLNGTPVDAEVAVVTKIGRTAYVVEAIYYDDGGRLHICETVYNGIAHVGDRFTGYVLPDVPDKLYRMPALWVLIVFLMLYGGLVLTCVILLVKSFKVHRENRLLSEKGIIAKAVILNVNKRKSFVYDCFVNFTDSEGTQQTVMVTFTKSVPAPDTECSIVYCYTPGGRLIHDLIEL